MKLIIVERDGVINQRGASPVLSTAQWAALPGSIEAIARLTHAGYRVVVATEQLALAEGRLDLDTLHAINDRMHHQVHECGGLIEAVFFCQDPDPDHPSRFPNPGLLEDLARRLNVRLEGVPVVSDSLPLLEAARRAGASPTLVRTGHGEHTLQEHPEVLRIPVFADLSAVTEHLLAAH